MAGKSSDPRSRSQKARDAAYASAAVRRQKRAEADLFEAAGRIALELPSATLSYGGPCALCWLLPIRAKSNRCPKRLKPGRHQSTGLLSAQPCEKKGGSVL